VWIQRSKNLGSDYILRFGSCFLDWDDWHLSVKWLDYHHIYYLFCHICWRYCRSRSLSNEFWYWFLKIIFKQNNSDLKTWYTVTESLNLTESVNTVTREVIRDKWGLYSDILRWIVLIGPITAFSFGCYLVLHFLKNNYLWVYFYLNLQYSSLVFTKL
jgi:hypothetical protein